MTHAVPEYTLEQLEAAGRMELDRFTSEDAFHALGHSLDEVVDSQKEMEVRYILAGGREVGALSFDEVLAHQLDGLGVQVE
mgnify:CR=1 FL=1